MAPDLLAIFETAAKYQIYHGLALLAVAWVVAKWPGWQAAWAGWLFLGGTAIFCGSLYALALTGIRAWGAVTPLGGIALILGWASLAWAIAAAR